MTSLVLAFTLALTTAPAAGAIESGGVGGRPANPRADNPRSQSIFIYDLKPGESIDDAVQVINNTNEEKNVDVYAVDSQVSSGGAFACAQKADMAVDAGKWIKVSGAPVTVAANTNTTVPFTLTMPADADVGEHNACIALQPIEPEQQVEGNGIALSFRSAIRVVATVPGDIKKELTIKSLETGQKDGDVIVTPVVSNTGNVSVDADVMTSLQGLFGGKQDGGTFPILRGRESRLDFSFEKPFWGGWYRAQTSVRYAADPSKRLGEDGGAVKTAEKSAAIFIAPAPGAAAILIVGLAVLAGLLVFGLRRRQTRSDERRSAIRYKVVRGDDIQSVASDHGVNWKTLVRINDLKPPFTLRPGQSLRIPADGARRSKRRHKG